MPDPGQQPSRKIKGRFEALQRPIESQIPNLVQRSGGGNVFNLAKQCLAIEKEACRLKILDAIGQKPAGAFEKTIDGNVGREFIPSAGQAVEPIPISGQLFDKADTASHAPEIPFE